MPLSLKDTEVRVALIEALQRKYPEHSALIAKYGVSFVTLYTDPVHSDYHEIEAKRLDVRAVEAYIECTQQEHRGE